MTTERIETAEQCEEWVCRGEASMFLIQVDGAPCPALFWTNEDGDWFGIRPITEDDGPWAELPEATRRTFAFQVPSPIPATYGDGDDEDLTPFTVLWQDGGAAESAPVDIPAPQVDEGSVERAARAAFVADAGWSAGVAEASWDKYPAGHPAKAYWRRIMEAALAARGDAAPGVRVQSPCDDRNCGAPSTHVTPRGGFRFYDEHGPRQRQHDQEGKR